MEKEYKLGNTIEEFEELFGNIPFESIEKIKEYLLNNFIPKSVIRNKINERQFELQQEYIDFKDDIKLNTLQDLYYEFEKRNK